MSSAGHEWIAEERRPLIDGPIGCDPRRAVLVALSGDLVEVDHLATTQRAEPAVVDAQEIGSDEVEHAAIEELVRPRGPKLGQNVVGRGEEHLMATHACAVAEGLRDVGRALRVASALTRPVRKAVSEKTGQDLYCMVPVPMASRGETWGCAGKARIRLRGFRTGLKGVRGG